MNLLKISAVLATAITAITAAVVLVNKNNIVSTCISEYYQDYELPGIHLITELSILSSTSQSHYFYTNLQGKVTINNDIYHLSRIQNWQYNLIDRKTSMMKVTLSSEDRDTSDTIEDTEVNALLRGKAGESRTIRVWRLDHDVLIIGNAYAPQYSCVRIE